MDHIFGDSHDIDFGSGSPSDATILKPNAGIEKQERIPHKNIVRNNTPRFTPNSNTGTRPGRDARPTSARPPLLPVEPAFVDTTPALTRLIAGMKSSFLPREDDTMNVRIVALSNHTDNDPLFLVRQDDTTILLGSGFGSIQRAGREYPTFPDMRLIFSEKEHIRAWILTDANINVTRFELILPTLGFPPIYGTRDVIAVFRNKIKNTSFLESCRFFELFADGTTSRRIGDIECIVSDINMTPSLGFRAGGSSFGFSHIPLISSDLGTSVPLVLSSGAEGFQIAKESFVTGEVLSLKGGKIARNAMKFTFDTFYVDGLSIGVVAGYALGDREQLAENGVLIFTLEEDTRVRTIAGHIFIDSRGFVHAYEMMYIHKEILKGIRASYEKFLTENPKIERGELVQGLRREITKYCYLLTGRTPVVMPIVIER
ncbi:hypothetical protein HOO68_04370 [Candidatus Gracilibacteria bacterium]|nr:hypothetical protein [Candidatus Gracilibacteria bacterium]